jgi:hypothetical protein
MKLCGESAHNLGDDCLSLDVTELEARDDVHTVQSDNAKDEDDRQCHDHDRVNLEPRGLIGV